MSGCYIGLSGLIKEIAHHVYCSLLYTQINLVSLPLPDSIKCVFHQTVKSFNFTKAKSSNSRIFRSLCDKIDSLYTTLLLHAEFRWLSRGNFLKHYLNWGMKFNFFITICLSWGLKFTEVECFKCLPTYLIFY